MRFPANNSKTSFATRLVASLLILISLPSTSTAAPDLLAPDELRLLSSVAKIEDTSQVTLAYRLRSPRPLRAHRMELAIGTIFSNADVRPFVSYGPVWRFPVMGPSTFVDVGFSPTVLAGSSFDGQDLGGNLHFTSSLSLVGRFGDAEKYSVALRAQHTSNGGLHRTNPGLDMVGLMFAVEFRD